MINNFCSRACVLGVFLLLLAYSVNGFAGIECGNSRYQATIYGSFEDASEAACSHQSGTTGIDYIEHYSDSIANVHCESCFDGTCKPWGGWTVSCSGTEYYADYSDLDIEDQTNGKSYPSSCNPINLITGNKYKIHTDVETNLNGGFLARPAFTRTYNSQLFSVQENRIGYNWRHTYQQSIKLESSMNSATNLSYDTGGAQYNPYQTSIYSTQRAACTEGFNEYLSNSASSSSVFGIALENATVRWEMQACRVYIGGRYIVTIPIRNHNVGVDLPVKQYAIKIQRSNGRVLHFVKDLNSQNSLLWKSADPDLNHNLEQMLLDDLSDDDLESPYFQSMTFNSVFKYIDEHNVVETYSDQGELLSIEYPNGITESLIYNVIDDENYKGKLLSRVENNFGKYIEFTYDDDFRINIMEDDVGRVWRYFYDMFGNLTKVINPDLTEKQYHYEDIESRYLLTGETDERGVRYSTFTYQADGRAQISYLGSPVTALGQQIERVSVSYGGGRNNAVTDSRGNTTRYHFPKKSIQGRVKKIDGPNCSYCSTPDAEYNYSADYKEQYLDTYPITLLSKTEFGMTTKYENYNSNGKPEAIIEASAETEQRKLTYTYDERFPDAITSVTEPSVFESAFKTTQYTYDDFTNITDITINGFTPDGIPVTRTSTFKYNGPFNQISEINGPRIDVNDITYFDYYPNDASQNNNRARLSAVRAYTGEFLRQNIEYTETGKVASEDRPNSLSISYLYYPGNDRLKDVVQTDTVSGAVRTVRYIYLATGEVESITQGADSANAVTLTLSYDNARRLTHITDGLNNYIEYILDTEGNVEKENIHDASGVLKKSLVQTFDNYNRLESFTQMNEGKAIDFNPDGTINTATDGKGVLADYSYDALKRLTTVTQDKNGTSLATANAVTQFGYDAQDNLTFVKDANDGETVYVYDDLGNLLSRTSPDTGVVTFQHDGAGNIVQTVDAKSKIFTYSYDIYNRRTRVITPEVEDSSTYAYDVCPQGYGKLCSSQRHNSRLSYEYNAFGEVTSLGQSLVTWAGYNVADNNVKYNYDAVGNLKSITYPSGAIVNYTYNAAGKIDNVNLDQNGSIKTLSLSVNYLPFGEETVQTYGNGMNVMGFYDQAYRPFIVGDPPLYYEYIFGYDANGNIEGVRTGGQGAYADSNFSYDEHQRLTSSTGFHDEFTYNYDLVGNKLTQNQSGTSTTASYSPNTNRLVSLAGAATNTDENGNIANLRGMSLTYTADNRLKSTNTGVSFEYHAQGQRSMKHSIAPGYAGTLSYHQSTSYVYGLSGELLAEVGPTGSVKKEYVYLNNKPLAMLDHKPDSNELFLKADMDNDGEISVEDFLIWYFNYRTDNGYEVTGDGIAGSDDINVVINCGLIQGNCVAASFSTDIYYIHNDHLGTPKMLTNSSREAVWRSITTPFGKAAINDDVDGDGIALEFNIRQPGQYYDAESGLYYNYYRYYDPETGRYITSDPIGLAGGINTYAYVKNNPLKYSDPYGLSPISGGACRAAVAGIGALGMAASVADWEDVSSLQDQLNRVENRRGSCDDPDELNKLTEIRDKLRNAITDAQGRNAMLFDSGLVTGAVSAIGIGVCGVISALPPMPYLP